MEDQQMEDQQMRDGQLEEVQVEDEQSEDEQREIGKPAKSPYSSAIFTVLAGPDHKSFLAHTSVLRKSETLSKMIDGEWKECQDKVVNLEEWDEETIARLLEFLYTKDYECPLPLDLKPTGVQHNASVPPIDNHASPEKSEQHNILRLKRPPTSNSADPDEPHYVIAPRQRNNTLLHSRLRNNKESLPYQKDQQSHHNVFEKWARTEKRWTRSFDSRVPLSVHSKLYALASFLLLPELGKVSLHRFGATMNAHALGKTPSFEVEHTQVLTDVARYVYNNPHHVRGGKEPMRHLLALFLVARMQALHEETVYALIEEEGDCAVDVLRQMKKIALDQDFELLAKQIGI